MKGVNLKILAEKLNVSVSTVSRALSDSYEISEETKKKVMELAKELNYRPNPYATSLRKQKSRTIAVIIPEIANNFFSIAINGIEEIAQEKGYHVLIYLTHENHLKETSIIKQLIGRVDGILMSMATETNDISHITELKEHNIPIVFFDRVCEKINTVKVTTDDFDSGFKATQHLIDQGCKKIAYLSVSLNLSIDQKRMQGYQKALEVNNLPADDNPLVSCSANDEENFLTIKNLLTSDNRPDAIFASVERLAITAYLVCRELKLSIPADIKVLGFSNLQTAPLLDPALTTITQPAFQMGKEAAIALFGALKRNIAELEDEKIILSSTLIERQSTKDID